jgi:hypothetical protein
MTDSAKQRSWLGPTMFNEGFMPSPRSGHGLVVTSNELYIFGGEDETGELGRHLSSENTFTDFFFAITPN